MKDLGERVFYNKSVSLGFIKDKFQEAVQRIRRLSHIPTTLSDKMLKAQMTAWSVATYSADTTFVGPRHFHELRKAILHMVVGAKQGASPWLCCMNISPFLHDPLLHVICTIVRTLGRLFRCQPELARNIVNMAASYTGTRPYGPASTFKRYLDLIDWSVQSDGTLIGPEHFQCNLFNDSTRDCVTCLRQAWPLYLIQQINRKGIGEFNLHPTLTRDVFQSYTNEEQLLLTHNLLGAFQSEKQKSLWAEDSQGICKLCGAEDTKEHRLLFCPSLESVRNKHPGAIRILKQCRPEWIHIPCARLHPDVMIHRALMHHLHNSKVNDMPDLSDIHHVKFFTDGGCMFPTDPFARIATWSVVMEYVPRGVDPQMVQHVVCNNSSNDNSWSPCHTVLGLGLVHGKQTAGRGEIQSILHAIRLANTIPPTIPAVFTTDAQYVCNIVDQIVKNTYKTGLHKKANPDIVTCLANEWDPDRFTVRKIKSHRHFASTESSDDFWQVLGNHCADKAATAALNHMPHPILVQAKQIFEFHQKEKKMLHGVFEFLIDFNRLRISLLQSHDQPDLHTPSGTDGVMNAIPPQPSSHNAMGTDALQILLNFKPEYTKTFDSEIDPTTFSAMQQGAAISHALFHWLKLLKWPDDTPATYGSSVDWGISWFELTISFIISSQLYFPIRIKGLGSDSVYADYHSPECLVQHPKKRAAYVQSFCLHKLVSALQTASGVRLFPKFTKTKCRSLQRLGFSEKHTGIPCRPVFPHQESTMRYVWQYLQSIGHGGYLNKPIAAPKIDSILPECTIAGIPPDQRYKNYLRLVKKLRRLQKDASG